VPDRAKSPYYQMAVWSGIYGDHLFNYIFIFVAMRGNYITGTAIDGTQCKGFIIDTVITMTPVAMPANPGHIAAKQVFPMPLTAYLVHDPENGGMYLVSPTGMEQINFCDEFVQLMGEVKEEPEEEIMPQHIPFIPSLVNGNHYLVKLAVDGQYFGEVEAIYTDESNCLYTGENKFAGRNQFWPMDVISITGMKKNL
jgi:hypothetical protein